MLSVILILPETARVSLERMDAIFDQLDAVDGGEQQEAKEIAAEEDAALDRHVAASGDQEKYRVVQRFEVFK